MSDILLLHDIDMMHTEKNVAEAMFHTTMETEKSSDNVKSRLDQGNMCDRPKYNILKPKPGKRWKNPAAPYVPTKPQRKEVLEWFQTLMFPDGYAANLRRG
jgi:hypothetical protein